MDEGNVFGDLERGGIHKGLRIDPYPKEGFLRSALMMGTRGSAKGSFIDSGNDLDKIEKRCKEIRPREKRSTSIVLPKTFKKIAKPVCKRPDNVVRQSSSAWFERYNRLLKKQRRGN